MGSSAKFRVKGSTDSPRQMLDSLVRSLRVSNADMQVAGERLKARVIARTAAGVDVDGDEFAPYSTKGPYYYYPRGKLGRGSHVGEGTLRRRAARIQAKIGGALTRGGGIKFASYAAFKESLGASHVDLRGPDIYQPHMMDQIQVIVRDRQIVLAITGEAEERAEAHDKGLGRNPVRHFLGASEADLLDIKTIVRGNMLARGRAILRNERIGPGSEPA